MHPFDLVFGGFRAERFPAIRAELGERSDLDGFLLAAPSLELMRELRPDEGFGDAVDDFAALVHAAYLFWRDGEQTVSLLEPATRALCRDERDDDALRLGGAGVRPPVTRYIQIAPRVIWAQLADDSPFEPLDGWFAISAETGLRVVGCLGVHAERPGMSVAVADGPVPARVRRTGGARLFAPTMPGGDAAHLHAVSAPEELLLLGWRATKAEESS